jgi:hypothetical protein
MAYTITISGKADQFMRGTGLGQGVLCPGDIAGTLALADAYGKRITRKRGRGYTVTLNIFGRAGVEALIEYMEAAIVANSDTNDSAEVNACRRAIAVCHAAMSGREG